MKKTLLKLILTILYTIILIPVTILCVLWVGICENNWNDIGEVYKHIWTEV